VPHSSFTNSANPLVNLVADQRGGDYLHRSVALVTVALRFHWLDTRGWQDTGLRSRMHRLGMPARCCKSSHSSRDYPRLGRNTDIAKCPFEPTREWPSRVLWIQGRLGTMRASSVAPGSRGVATYPTALCVEGDGHLAGSKRCGHSTDRPLVRDLTRSRE